MGCTGVDCYAPETCQAVIDANGGPVSPSVDLLVEAGGCFNGCGAACGGVAPGQPVEATLTIRDFVSDEPVAGAEICIADSADCSMTDPDGLAALEVPALSEVALVVTADGYATVLWGVVTEASAPELTLSLRPTSLVEGDATAAGVVLDPGKGVVSFSLFGPSGATAELSPDSGTLVWYDADGNPDPTLTGSIEGASPSGIFFNVDPGDYDLVFGHSEGACRAGAVSTWEGSTSDAAKVTVIAGAMSIGGHWGECASMP